jgi:putative ABC transport system substrate-binding protein
MAHPGGNVTGLTSFHTELEGKRIEIIRALVPGVRRIAALLNMGNSGSTAAWKKIEEVSKPLGIQPLLLDVRKAEDLPSAFDKAVAENSKALVVGIDTLTQANASTIVQLGAKHRLPTIFPSREFVTGGGLVSYGINYPYQYSRAALMVEKILKGARAGDLPIEMPQKFEFVLNHKTAKALGLSIPQDLLVRADEVIE